MTNYERGRAKEYQTMKTLQKMGYHTFRMSGSHTPFDVIAVLWKEGTELPLIRFIQVKFGKYISKGVIEELKKIKLPSVIQKEIWHYRPKKKPRIIII